MKLLSMFVSGAVALAASVPLALADEATTPEVGAVDALQALFGKHPGLRANHVKGVMLEATFTPTAEAAELSRAPLFAGPSKAVVRFSDPTGLPDIPDGDPNANPHGMATQFTTASGDVVSMVTIASPKFPVATAADFRDLNLALAATKPDSPKPTPVEKFIGAHPAVLDFIKALPPTPTSFATETYYGLDAFRLVAKGGAVANVRFRFVPEVGESRLTADEAKAKSPTFLIDEIGPRAKAGNAKFKLVAQIGAKDDPTDDATKFWPEDRKLVELGELVVTSALPNSAEAEKQIVFMPSQLCDGIEVSDDPLIQSRTAAYAESFGRRQ